MVYEIIQSRLGNDLLVYYQSQGKDCNSVEEAIQILNSTHDTGVLWYLLTKSLILSDLQLQLCAVIETDKVNDGQVKTSSKSELKTFNYTLDSGDIVCFKVVKAGKPALMPGVGLPKEVVKVAVKAAQQEFKIYESPAEVPLTAKNAEKHIRKGFAEWLKLYSITQDQLEAEKPKYLEDASKGKGKLAQWLQANGTEKALKFLKKFEVPKSKTNALPA